MPPSPLSPPPPPLRYPPAPAPSIRIRKGVTGEFDSDVLRLHYDSLTTPHSVIDHHIPSGRRKTRKVRGTRACARARPPAAAPQSPPSARRPRGAGRQASAPAATAAALGAPQPRSPAAAL
jgi:hypothetical protein